MPAPASDAALRAITGAYQRQQLALAANTTEATGRLWDRVGGIDDKALAGWVDAVTPVVEAGELAMVRLTDAYYAQYVTAATGVLEQPLGLGAELTGKAVRGVATDTVYARPVITARAALAQAKPLSEAIAIARARATQTARTDMVVVARNSARSAMAPRSLIVGYRRIPDGDACPFCILASTQRYHVRDLMPIHPSCGCSTAPIIGSRDPGGVLDTDLRDALMAADPALGKRGMNRQRAREIAAEKIAVHEHGELGPVLYPSGQHFAAV